METKPEKPRTLNMEEKRKIEKLLLQDIDRAESNHDRKASDVRQELVTQLKAAPPADVRALLATYQKAMKTAKSAEENLGMLGWSLAGYSEKTLDVKTYGTVCAPLSKFNEKTAKQKAALAALKRSYTLKLFAGDGEAAGLFEALANELTAITK